MSNNQISSPKQMIYSFYSRMILNPISITLLEDSPSIHDDDEVSAGPIKSANHMDGLKSPILGLRVATNKHPSSENPSLPLGIPIFFSERISKAAIMSASDRHEDFPWHLGVFDAHCHPTDTMESVASIPNMKTKVLTVMATRSEDQELVSNVADDVGLRGDQDPISRQWKDASKMVPCFGWHPWFTHQMFDETEYEGVTTLDQSQKVAYYQSVLVPKPEDKEFLCSLPEPRPFSQFLAQTRQYLQRHQLALVGEVGLDKGFRIPIPGPPQNREDGSGYISQTPGARDGRPLSPYRVSMEHQRKLLKAQFRLA